MEVGEKLKELDMTSDEVDRLTKAFKDEKFREMLRDYARELSDPENKRRYEEEIKLLEQKRGNSVEFIHPKPFKSLKTSVDGKRKCFINICANDKIGAPLCECGVSEDGRRGQSWSLPHSLHPGRQDIDAKGNKIVIYDVIFHPDTLHIASKNKRFMDMVDGTAIQGIQNAFKVTLDKNNVRQMKTSYKGTPWPCLIQKPMPGYKAKEPSEEPDPLAFPYPDEKRPTTFSETKSTDSPATKNSSGAKPKSFQIQPQESKEPTKPNYTIKYRSFVDLQDFRCSRDSARSSRPKEIVITIDMPLLKSVKDTSLEIKEKNLLLDSKKPSYRLELPLAYPVDEDKGEAKFNKQRRQLTVILPVLPSNEAFNFAAGPATTVSDTQGVGDDKGKGTESGEDEWKEQERGSKEGEEEQSSVEVGEVKEEREVEDEDSKQQTKVEKGEDQEVEEQTKNGQDGVKWEENVVDSEGNWRKQKQGGEKKEEKFGSEEDVKWQKQNREGQKYVVEERGIEDEKSDKISESEVEEQLKELKHENDEEIQSISITAEYVCDVRERGETNPKVCLESTPKMETLDVQEAKKTNKTVQGSEQLEADAAFLSQATSEESHAAASPTPAETTPQNHDCSTPQRTEAPARDEANEPSVVPCRGKQEGRMDMDEDDLPTEQILQISERDKKPPPAVLREVDKDGNETVISDHSTSVEFIFQNALIYELD